MCAYVSVRRVEVTILADFGGSGRVGSHFGFFSFFYLLFPGT